MRADPEPALLAAPEIAPAGHRLPRDTIGGVPTAHQRRIGKGASGQAGARLRGAEKRRVHGGTRSVLRELTRCGCSSVANEVSRASSATQP
ncbi:MAG TPA: hypothetical protein VLI72_03785 [Methylibium sp.]|nr:hypothetical protein [Methylibium sp.]